MMKSEISKKTILNIILCFLFVCYAFSVKAQTRLDDIHLNLPQEYDWNIQPPQFKRDSTERVQTWDVKDKNGKKELGVVINSIDKTEINTDFKGAQKLLLQQIDRDQHVELVDKSKTPGGYPFVVYKGALSHKAKGRPNSYLMAMIETKTSLHELLVADLKKDISQKYVDTWKEILKHPIIEPSKAKAPKKTQFTLSTTKNNAFADSAIKNRLRKSFRVRLRSIYKRQLSPADISFKKGSVALTFRGSIDQDAIRKMLAENVPVQFSPLYRGLGYQHFSEQADSLIAAQTGKNIYHDMPPYTSPLPASMNKIPAPEKGSLLLRLEKLLKKQPFHNGLKIVTGPDRDSDDLFLYLVDTQNVIADGSNLVGLILSYETENEIILNFNASGKEQLASWSRQHKGDFMAIIADGNVLTAPKITSEIPDGRFQISGDYYLDQLFDMYNTLQLSYPIPLKIESVKTLN